LIFPIPDFVCAMFDFSASDDTQKSYRSRPRMHRSLGSSHRSMSRSFSVDSQSKGSISMPQGWTVYILFFSSLLDFLLLFYIRKLICWSFNYWKYCVEGWLEQIGNVCIVEILATLQSGKQVILRIFFGCCCVESMLKHRNWVCRWMLFQTHRKSSS